MPVTIREVAKAAGVSTAAVSKVLHGRGDSVRVSAERAEEIRRIAKEMQYYPNAIARSLRSSRTQTVGLIFENFGEIAAGPLYYVYMLDGVASTLFRQHYRLTVLPEVDDSAMLSSLGDGRLDAVIWCKMIRDPRTLDLIRDCPIPIVALNTPPPPEARDAVFVSCDNETGIELAIRHLRELGHREFTFVAETNETMTPDAVARERAYRRILKDKGLADSADRVVIWQPGAKEFANWRAQNPNVTAIIGWNDRIAAETIAAAKAYGLQVPQDLSVIGFDSTQFCETIQPRLTSVRQPIQEMARRATEVLLAMIEGHMPNSSSFVFPCSLDVRDSTGPIST